MKQVFEYIDAQLRSFSKKPLFVFLRDANVDPAQRLKFVPYAAHFVMSFADLYHFFLTEPSPGDRYQELVNVHLSEEGTHWKWFLSDLTNLGLDPTLRFTDAVRFLWGDATVKTRALAYEMCKLSAGLTSLEKLVMVMAIEATGRAALEAAVPAGCEAEAASGRHLVYFGSHHLETERKHTLEEDHVHSALADEVLSEPVRAGLFSIVDRVFGHFGGFVDEALEAARDGNEFSQLLAKQAVPAQRMTENRP